MAIPRPPMKPKRASFWWEEFLEIERSGIGGAKDPRFLLILKETGAIVGAGDNTEELNERARFILDKIFENNVLSNE